jgi:hypothetical protein
MLENTSYHYFRIADHFIRIIDRASIELGRCLPSFSPFSVSGEQVSTLLLEIVLTDNPLPQMDGELELLSDVAYIMDERFILERGNGGYYTSILSGNGERDWSMQSAMDFSRSAIFLKKEDLYTTSKLSWLIMIAYGQACLREGTLLLHASAIICRGEGYAFLGKSGTGKSTHSRLWLEHIPGSELLNDDNPAVRVHLNGEIFIYGTPWSGKTHCYRNQKARLAGITRLEQGPRNEFGWKKGRDALIALLPSGSAIRWDGHIYSMMLGILEKLIAAVPVGHLVNLPTREAAELHLGEYQNMKKVK